MLRKLFALTGLTLASSALGCAMCQDCLDETGPVPEGPNYHSFEHMPRAGSASGGVIVEEGAIIEGPAIEMGTEYSQ